MAIETRPHLTQFVGEILVDMWPRHDGPNISDNDQYVLMFSNGKKLVLGIMQSPHGGYYPSIECEEK